MFVEKVWFTGRPSNSFRACVAVVIGEGPFRFCVRGMRILDTGRGPYLVMPSRKLMGDNGDTVYEEIFHPVNKEFRAFLEKEVLASYRSRF